MQFKTHNETTVEVGGTSLQGYIDCDYETLIEVFGSQMHSGFDDYKSDAEWHIRFADNTVATIYNWKNGFNYLGSAGKHVTQITEWNVGGNDGHAVNRIESAIKEYLDAKALAASGRVSV
jgi:hypothetical protein